MQGKWDEMRDTGQGDSTPEIMSRDIIGLFSDDAVLRGYPKGGGKNGVWEKSTCPLFLSRARSHGPELF